MKNQRDAIKFKEDYGFCRQLEQQQQVLGLTAAALGASAAVAAGAGALGTAALGAGVSMYENSQQQKAQGSNRSALGAYNTASTPLYNLQYQSVDPSQTSQSALDFNNKNTAEFGQIAQTENQSALDSRLQSLKQIAPAWSTENKIAGKNDTALLSGVVPSDVQQQLAQSNAYQSYKNGLGSNPSAVSGNLAKSLGLTSLGLQQQGSQDAQNWAKTDVAVALPTQVTPFEVQQQLGANAGLFTKTAEDNSQGKLSAQEFNVTGQQNVMNNDLATQMALNNQQANSNSAMVQGIGSSVAGLAGQFAAGAGSGGGNYSNNFGSDMMNSAGGYETSAAAAGGGVYNPTFYSMGANSGFYAGT